MKTKLVLTLLLITLCTAFSQAQSFTQDGTKITVTGNVAGGLSSLLTGKTGITELKISGNMNAEDFGFLGQLNQGPKYSSTLLKIDLSGLQLIAAFDDKLEGEFTGAGNSNGAFQGLGVLKEIIWPAKSGVIKTIGVNAFYGCSAISSLTLPAGITSIGERSFMHTGLTAFDFPSSVTTLGKELFKYSKIESFNWPAHLTTIPEGTFSSTPLKTITIPAGVTAIGKEAFESTKLTAFPSLPQSLKSIGSSTFSKVSTLDGQEIILPATLEEIGGYGTFRNTGISKLEMPAGIKMIRNDDGVSVFEDVLAGTKVTQLTIPADVEQIRGTLPENLSSLTFASGSKLTSISGLYGLQSLTALVLPEGVKTIGGFGNLNGLKLIELPSTLEMIQEGQYFFSEGMEALESIIMHAAFPPEITDGGTFEGIPDKSKVTLFVPNSNAVTLYKEANVWKDFTIKVIGSDAQSQTIDNFNDIVAAVGEEVTLTATASSKLPVTYSIADESIASVSGNKLTIRKEGETTITAKQAGDGINFQAVEKTVKVIVMNLAWLEAPTILISGSSAKIVGPAEAAARFTKFFVNDAEMELKSGVADLTDKKGELILKATTADGTEIIKLKINKQ